MGFFEIVHVETRDHHRGAQEPIRFRWRSRDFQIARIVDRWYEGRPDSSRVPLLYFRVETTCGESFILRYHELFCAWSVKHTMDHTLH